MPRVLLCLALSPSAPALIRADAPPRVSPFGRWLRQQVMVTARLWPAVAIHRLGFAAAEVRLTLVLRHPVPPLVAGLAVARALQRETTAAARAAGWLESGGELWRVGGTVVVALAGGRPERSEGLASCRYERTRQSSTIATTKNTIFIDHAASHGTSSPWPPTAFMTWIPVR